MHSWARIGAAGAVGALSVCAGAALGAPELIVNGGGEHPIHHGWQVQGPAFATGLLRDGQGGVLAPDQGRGFLVLGPGGLPQITQSGPISANTDRLGLRATFRRPGSGAVLLTLRLRDDAGAVLAERTVSPALAGAWGGTLTTLGVPRFADTWEVTVLGVFPGSLGVHADGVSLIGTCLADFNADRVLNFFDIAAYLTLYLAGDPDADLTGNGVVDFFDISDLIDLVQLGCE